MRTDHIILHNTVSETYAAHLRNMRAQLLAEVARLDALISYVDFSADLNAAIIPEPMPTPPERPPLPQDVLDEMERARKEAAKADEKLAAAGLAASQGKIDLGNGYYLFGGLPPGVTLADIPASNIWTPENDPAANVGPIGPSLARGMRRMVAKSDYENPTPDQVFIMLDGDHRNVGGPWDLSREVISKPIHPQPEPSASPDPDEPLNPLPKIDPPPQVMIDPISGLTVDDTPEEAEAALRKAEEEADKAGVNIVLTHNSLVRPRGSRP